MTWLVVALAVVLVGWGFFKHGISAEVHQRFWADIFGRTDGPMTFRFFLQPTMAAIAAVHDGLKDARSGHKAFFWTALWDPSQPTGRLREGLTATARIMLLGIAMVVLPGPAIVVIPLGGERIGINVAKLYVPGLEDRDVSQSIGT